MGTRIVKLPDIGEGVAEAELVSWHVKVGDIVREDQPLAEVMNGNLVTAAPLEPAREVAYRLADHQLNALPVVDDDGRLVGVVTIDSAVGQIAPETLRRSVPRVFA